MLTLVPFDLKDGNSTPRSLSSPGGTGKIVGSGKVPKLSARGDESRSSISKAGQNQL